MGRWLKIFYQQIPLIIFLLFYCLLSLLTYRAYGLTNDEPEEYFLGKLLYIKLRANDPVLEKSFVINSGDSNLYDYDRIYQAVLYTFNSGESYEIYHLLNLLFASVIFIASYQLLLKVTKKGWLAIWGPIFILLMPRFLGHIAANPKDVPFAISYFISLILIYFFGTRRDALALLFLGISFGLTQSLRVVGFSIYVVYVAYLALLNKEIFKPKNWFQILPALLIIVMLGFLLNMFTLPYLGADPIGNFGHLLTASSRYPWRGEVLFLGNLVNAQNLPLIYLPIWLLVTTPWFMLFLLFFPVRSFNKPEQVREKPVVKLFTLALLINLSIYFLLKPVIYDGLRHFLFLLPIIATLASLKMIHFIKAKSFFIVVLLILDMAIVVFNLVKLFPYQYIYFNQFVGGVRGAYKQFDLDYWGASYREAVLWANKNLDQNQTYQVFSCGDPAQFTYYATFKANLVSSLDQADLVICHLRGNNQQKIANFGQEIFAVKRNGVKLLEIKEK